MPDRFRLEQLRRRVEANPASIAFATLAEEYRRAGMLDEAMATCQAGLRRHPAYASARITLAFALLDAERLDEAHAELEQVLRVAPDNLSALRGLARIQDMRTMTPERRQLEALDGLLAAIHHARAGSRAAQ